MDFINTSSTDVLIKSISRVSIDLLARFSAFLLPLFKAPPTNPPTSLILSLPALGILKYSLIVSFVLVVLESLFKNFDQDTSIVFHFVDFLLSPIATFKLVSDSTVIDLTTLILVTS